MEIAPVKSTIAYDIFEQVDIRVGTIDRVEEIDGADEQPAVADQCQVTAEYRADPDADIGCQSQQRPGAHLLAPIGPLTDVSHHRTQRLQVAVDVTDNGSLHFRHTSTQKLHVLYPPRIVASEVDAS